MIFWHPLILVATSEISASPMLFQRTSTLLLSSSILVILQLVEVQVKLEIEFGILISIGVKDSVEVEFWHRIESLFG